MASACELQRVVLQKEGQPVIKVRFPILTLTLVATAVTVASESLAASLSSPLTWSVTAAEGDPDFAKYSGGHALWNLLGTKDKWIFDGGPGTFAEGLGPAGRDALLTGTIVNKDDLLGPMYEVHVEFELLESFDEYTPATGEPKLELYEEAYDPAFVADTGSMGESGGPGNMADIDPRAWRYYRLIGGAFNGGLFSGSYLTIVGDTVDYYLLTPRPADFSMELQVGLGASGKNLDMGMATWFYSQHTLGTQTGDKIRGDINVNLPEPGTMLLMGLGLASLGVMRRRRG